MDRLSAYTYTVSAVIYSVRGRNSVSISWLFPVVSESISSYFVDSHNDLSSTSCSSSNSWKTVNLASISLVACLKVHAPEI